MRKSLNRQTAQQAIDDLYYYFYNLYLRDRISDYSWERFKNQKWEWIDLITADDE